MPFIDQWRRHVIEHEGLEGLSPVQPGDRCYVFYKQMMDQWRANPRWATVHQLYKDFAEHKKSTTDDLVAQKLALDVFFYLHVLEYEKLKRQQNGDI